MSEVGTNERLLRSDVTLEESRKIERVLRRNNISYFEKWNFHTRWNCLESGGFSSERYDDCGRYPADCGCTVCEYHQG